MKTSIAMLGGAAALLMGVGFASIGVDSGGATSPASRPSAGVAPALRAPSSPAVDVHRVILAGCIGGLDC